MDALEYPDEQAASSPATAEEDITDGAAGGVQPEVDPKTGVPFSEHPRWKEVYGSLKEFKALGASPEQLKDALDRVASYDRLAAEARKEAAPSAPLSEEQQEIAEQRKQLVAALEAAIPGISKLPQMMQSLEAQDEYRAESLRARAEEELVGLMTKAGVGTTSLDILRFSSQIQTILQQEKKLSAMYWTDPASAVRGAWKHFIDTVAAPLSRSERAAAQQKGASLSSLPRAGQGGGGGSPAGKGAAPPQTINELFKQNKGLLVGKE